MYIVVIPYFALKIVGRRQRDWFQYRHKHEFVDENSSLALTDDIRLQINPPEPGRVKRCCRSIGLCKNKSSTYDADAEEADVYGLGCAGVWEQKWKDNKLLRL